VKDGKCVLSKGYGIRELGKDAKVDTQTLFGLHVDDQSNDRGRDGQCWLTKEK
jgi:hypothetical protein